MDMTWLEERRFKSGDVRALRLACCIRIIICKETVAIIRLYISLVSNGMLMIVPTYFFS